MLVIGGREVESQTVAVRDRREGDLGAMTLEEALKKFGDEIADKTVRQ
jgi:threonyl-tRNA synthetase